MPRPSKTDKWPTTSAITIHLNDSDIIGHYSTNDKGCVNTNKRSYNNLTATVIYGNPVFLEKRIEVDNNTQLWECQINNVGALSSIGSDLKNVEVTVIIHNH